MEGSNQSSGRRFEGRTLSVVVPTRNERDNIGPLLDALEAHETIIDTVVFVDDSEDDTALVARECSAYRKFRVNVLHRGPGERTGGLGGAVIAGLQKVQTPYAVVMDGDLQHPPSVLPALLSKAIEGNCDLVVATRYATDGSNSGLGSPYRRAVSVATTEIAKRAFPETVGRLTDPMSGFFLIKREVLDYGRIKPHGFKILVEIAATHPSLRAGEVSFVFGERIHGVTKANTREGLRYLRQLASLKRRMRRVEDAHVYDIHGLMSIRSQVPLPELARLEVPGPHRSPEIDVRIARSRPRETNGLSLHFKESPGWLGFAMDLTIRADTYWITASPLLRLSPHVLYTNVVEPVMRWALAERGYALVHAACLEHDGLAYLITAPADTGKTTTLMRLLRRGSFRFVSDDLVVLNEVGRVWGLPKPLTISQHTLWAAGTDWAGDPPRRLSAQSRLHSRSGRKAAFAMTRFRLPVATINAIVQYLIPPPKYDVASLVAEADVSGSALLSEIYAIRRGSEKRRLLSPEETTQLLLENTEDAFGFPPYHQIERFLRMREGRDLSKENAAVVAAAVAAKPTVQVTSRNFAWAESLADQIARPKQLLIDLTGQEPEIRIGGQQPKDAARATVLNG